MSTCLSADCLAYSRRVRSFLRRPASRSGACAALFFTAFVGAAGCGDSSLTLVCLGFRLPPERLVRAEVPRRRYHVLCTVCRLECGVYTSKEGRKVASKARLFCPSMIHPSIHPSVRPWWSRPSPRELMIISSQPSPASRGVLACAHGGPCKPLKPSLQAKLGRKLACLTNS